MPVASRLTFADPRINFTNERVQGVIFAGGALDGLAVPGVTYPATSELELSGSRGADGAILSADRKQVRLPIRGGGDLDAIRIVTTSDVTALVDADPTANGVPEGAAGGTAVGITALSTGAGGLTYSLSNSAGGRFTINPANGAVTVASGAVQKTLGKGLGERLLLERLAVGIIDLGGA